MKWDPDLEATIVGKYVAVAPVLDERSRRGRAAAESMAIGSMVETPWSRWPLDCRETIRRGRRREIARGEEPTGRIRAPGAGRPGIEQGQPGIVAALEALADPLARGTQPRRLRWTCKSAKLTAALTEQGWRVSSTAVGRLRHCLGYRLQSVRKRREGTTHPDRNAQFEHISATADRLLRRRASDLGRHEEEAGGQPRQRGPGLAAEGDAAGDAGARLPERRGGQSDTLPRPRHGSQRSVGELRPRSHAVDAGCVAARTPRGFSHRLLESGKSAA